ncbi:MAG: hypothetical protein KDD70_09190 [Bdellovibrionales bacterium]|nr:hypothetical protein [Bdellovibrionales bacterium]
MLYKIFALGLPSLCLLLTYALAGELRYTSALSIHSGQLHGISFFSNAFSPWSADPITSLVFSGSYPASEVMLGKEKYLSSFFFLVAALGLGARAALERQSPILFGLVGGLLLSALQIYLGIDVVTIGALCWIPWVLFAVSLREERIGLTLSCLFIYLSIASSGTAILPLMPALFLATSKIVRPSVSVLALATVLSLAVALPFVPDWTVPNYPGDGHVVSDDGVPGIVRPLTSEASPVPIINRTSERSTLFFPTFLLAIALVLTIPIGKGEDRPLILAIGTLTLITFFDLTLSEDLALINPLQTYRRVIPEAFAPSISTIMSCGILLLIAGLRNSSTSLPIAAVILLGSIFHGFQSNYLSLGSFTDKHSDKLASDAFKASSNIQRIIFSPSFSVIRQYQLSFEDLTNIPKQETKTQTLSGKDFHIVASEGSTVKKRKLLDDNRQTRMRVGPGGQRGGEFFCVELNESLRAVEIRLSTGVYFSDFPRALRVTEGDNCESIRSAKNAVHTFKPWEGSLLFTTDGFPYFGRQAVVQLRPRNPTRAVLFEQLGKSPYDWSIAEMQITATENTATNFLPSFLEDSGIDSSSSEAPQQLSSTPYPAPH